jgi:polyisoprenoid-binding protein YceI
MRSLLARRNPLSASGRIPNVRHSAAGRHWEANEHGRGIMIWRGNRGQRRLPALIAMLAAIMLLAACGGGDATATLDPVTTTTTTTTAAPASAATTSTTSSDSVVTSATTAPDSTTTTAAATATTVVTTTTTPGSTTAAQPATTTAASTASESPRVAASPAASPTIGSAERYAIIPEQSTATYHVNETFVGQGLSTATGSTSAISGDIFINKTKPSASTIGTITVDISTLTSDRSQRDDAIRGNWLESKKYPTATFVTKRIEGLPDTSYTDGQQLNFKIIGDLTVRTVTKEVTFDATGKVVGDTFTGTAHTTFNMTDFGFDPPSIFGVLKAENGVILDLAIQAKRTP